MIEKIIEEKKENKIKTEFDKVRMTDKAKDRIFRRLTENKIESEASNENFTAVETGGKITVSGTHSWVAMVAVAMFAVAIATAMTLLDDRIPEDEAVGGVGTASNATEQAWTVSFPQDLTYNSSLAENTHNVGEYFYLGAMKNDLLFDNLNISCKDGELVGMIARTNWDYERGERVMTLSLFNAETCELLKTQSLVMPDTDFTDENREVTLTNDDEYNGSLATTDDYYEYLVATGEYSIDTVSKIVDCDDEECEDYKHFQALAIGAIAFTDSGESYTWSLSADNCPEIFECSIISCVFPPDMSRLYVLCSDENYERVLFIVDPDGEYEKIDLEQQLGLNENSSVAVYPTADGYIHYSLSETGEDVEHSFKLGSFRLENGEIVDNKVYYNSPVYSEGEAYQRNDPIYALDGKLYWVLCDDVKWENIIISAEGATAETLYDECNAISNNVESISQNGKYAVISNYTDLTFTIYDLEKGTVVNKVYAPSDWGGYGVLIDEENEMLYMPANSTGCYIKLSFYDTTLSDDKEQQEEQRITD